MYCGPDEWNWESLLDIVTRLGLGDRGNVVRFPAEAIYFPSPKRPYRP